MKVERQSILASSLQTQSCKELRECFMVQNERRLLVEVAGVAVEVVEEEEEHHFLLNNNNEDQ